MLIFKTRKRAPHSPDKILLYYELQRVISAIKKIVVPLYLFTAEV